MRTLAADPVHPFPGVGQHSTGIRACPGRGAAGEQHLGLGRLPWAVRVCGGDIRRRVRNGQLVGELARYRRHSGERPGSAPGTATWPGHRTRPAAGGFLLVVCTIALTVLRTFGPDHAVEPAATVALPLARGAGEPAARLATHRLRTAQATTAAHGGHLRSGPLRAPACFLRGDAERYGRDRAAASGSIATYAIAELDFCHSAASGHRGHAPSGQAALARGLDDDRALRHRRHDTVR
jgi:hypothetical protein